MSTKPDGGPAYPGESLNRDVFDTLREHRDVFSASDARNIASKHPGMSLRDYFAAKAMAALLGSTKTGGWLIGEGGKDNALIGHSSYVIADAMLAERAK